ncbi:viroplasmin family protein [Niallia taxi]|nr:viroplasmin family protein [Niallia taxi]MDE5051762.1 viroplasmin family protein [Niallia taxi]
MAKKNNYYAVRTGRQPGIYKTWAECQKQISGFSGAEYKGFVTEEEAQTFINVISSKVMTPETNEEIDKAIKELDEKTLIAFVDGTYSKDSTLYGYGIVFINSKGEEETLYGSDDNESYKESANVAGEIEGVKVAITHALVQAYKKIIIYYDYEGIEKWASKDWKANKSVSKDYVKFIEEMRYSLDIEFNKVTAHTGIKYNEIADQLAKKSLVQRGIKTKAEGTLSVSGIDKEEFKGIFEILKELNQEVSVTEKTEIENRNVYIVRLNSDRIIVTLYDNGSTLIQGKQSSIMELFTTLVVELIPEREVVELLNTYNHHSVSVPETDLDKAFVAFLPDFDKGKTDNQTLINTLKAAVYNTIVDSEKPDYTDLISPVFRALEFYLYEILINKGIINKYDGKHGFNCFDSNDKVVYFLQKGHESKFSSEPNQLTYLNKLYNLYHNVRNVYCHWDKTGMTETIDSMEDARIKIKDHLQIFNEYYLIF